MADDKNKRAVEVFSQHRHKLAEVIDDPIVLASKLKEHDYISDTLHKKLQSKGDTDEQKSIFLLDAIEKYLKYADDEAYEHLEKIMAILDKVGGTLKMITKKMRKELTDTPSATSPQTAASNSHQAAANLSTSQQPGCSQASLGKTPTMHQLLCMRYTRDGKEAFFRLMDQLTPNWDRLATAMRFPGFVVATVGKKDEDNRVSYIFSEWLRGANEEEDDRPLTWATLIAALKEAKLTAEVKVLEAHLDEMLRSSS